MLTGTILQSNASCDFSEMKFAWHISKLIEILDDLALVSVICFEMVFSTQSASLCWSA